MSPRRALPTLRRPTFAHGELATTILDLVTRRGAVSTAELSATTGSSRQNLRNTCTRLVAAGMLATAKSPDRSLAYSLPGRDPAGDDELHRVTRRGDAAAEALGRVALALDRAQVPRRRGGLFLTLEERVDTLAMQLEAVLEQAAK